MSEHEHNFEVYRLLLITHSFALHKTMNSQRRYHHIYMQLKTPRVKSKLPTFLQLARAETGAGTKVSISLLLTAFHYFKLLIGLGSHHDIYVDIYWHLSSCTQMLPRLFLYLNNYLALVILIAHISTSQVLFCPRSYRASK